MTSPRGSGPASLFSFLVSLLSPPASVDCLLSPIYHRAGLLTTIIPYTPTSTRTSLILAFTTTIHSFIGENGFTLNKDWLSFYLRNHGLVGCKITLARLCLSQLCLTRSLSNRCFQERKNPAMPGPIRFPRDQTCTPFLYGARILRETR